MTCSARSFSSLTQLRLEAPRPLRRRAAAARAGDRVVVDRAVLDAHQHLRRGADDLGVAEVEVDTCRATG